MRAAILGAGSAGLLHGLALKAHGVTIDAVYDPDQDKARALADLLHASIAPRSDDTGDAEVIAICSPPSLHAEQAAVFAREGRTVLLEKPIALDQNELDRISGLSRCYSALQWRFGRSLRAIRAAIAVGPLLVPFVGAALRGSPDAPTIADAAPAHRAIYRVYEASTQNA